MLRIHTLTAVGTGLIGRTLQSDGRGMLSLDDDTSLHGSAADFDALAAAAKLMAEEIRAAAQKEAA